MAIDRDSQEIKDLIQEVTDALASKNSELLRELKVAKAKARGTDIDPEEHARLQSAVEDLESRAKSSETKSRIDAEKLAKVAGEKDIALSRYLIDAGISDALAKSGVAPHYVNAVKALFKGQAVLKSEAGEYSASIGDKSISETISAWAASDEGKHFVSAPANTGGGAAGGKQGNGSAKFSEMTSEAKVALFRTDPTAYAAAKTAG